MQTDVTINLINHSADRTGPPVLLLKKNKATSGEEIAVAWQLIRNLAFGQSYTFTVPAGQELAATDSWGNRSPLQPALPGQQWLVKHDTLSKLLVNLEKPQDPSAGISVKNALHSGSIDAQLYKDGKLLAVKVSVAPQQEARFAFDDTLWVGVAGRDIGQGAVINSAIISAINTQISLLGLANADLVLTGGGRSGSQTTPYVFTLVPRQ